MRRCEACESVLERLGGDGRVGRGGERRNGGLGPQPGAELGKLLLGGESS